MVDIFLVHDGEVFELCVRGPITSDNVASVAGAVSYLPDHCIAVVDLTEVPTIDGPAATAMRRSLAERRASARNLVVAAVEVQVRSALVALEEHLVPVLASVEQARRTLSAVPA